MPSNGAPKIEKPLIFQTVSAVAESVGNGANKA